MLLGRNVSGLHTFGLHTSGQHTFGLHTFGLAGERSTARAGVWRRMGARDLKAWRLLPICEKKGIMMVGTVARGAVGLPRPA